MSTKVNGGGDE